MKKAICLGLLCISLLGLTGCSGDTEGVNKYDLYKYTNWTSTDGYDLQLLDEACQLAKDDVAYRNVCKFESNASGTGVGVLELCDMYGTDCDKTDIRYYSSTKTLKGKSIIVYGKQFYYTGKLKRD